MYPGSHACACFFKMAASFGLWEVNFPTSRAVEFDEDEEDEEIETQQAPIFFTWSPSMLEELGDSSFLSCSLLLVGVGELCSTFLEANFPSVSSGFVGILTDKEFQGSFDVKSKLSNLENIGLLCRLTGNPTVIVCLLNADIPQERAFVWAEKVFQSVKPSKAVVLSSAPSAEFHTTDPRNLPSDFVRMLKTDLWQEKCPDGCSFLETPNTIRAVSAAVLTHCQIFQVPAALYVCYTESSYIDSRSVNAFNFLLNTTPFNTLQQGSSEEVTRRLNLAGHGKLASSNLYL